MIVPVYNKFQIQRIIMTEKFGKFGLSSGTSWNLFAENTVFEESEEAVVVKLGKSAETTRLHIEDSSKFGYCPSQAGFHLSVCKQCQKLIMVSSLQRHYELKHIKFLSSVKPASPKCYVPHPHLSPNNVNSAVSDINISNFIKPVKLLNKSSKTCIRIEEINPNEENVKIEEVPLTIPHFKNPADKLKLPKISFKKCEASKSKLISPVTSPCISLKTKKSVHIKEYDADKHCGVWIADQNKNCTRSLTCKTHTLSLRRQVPGRSKHFDILLAEHRARVALKAQENVSSNSRNNTPMNSPYSFDKTIHSNGPVLTISSREKDLPGSNLKSPKTNFHNQLSPFTKQSEDIPDDVIGSSNLPTLLYHPRPMKINSFGSRQTNLHCRIFSRRNDHVYYAATSLIDQLKSSSSASCMNLNLKDPAKLKQEGISSVIHDPIQKGTFHKQRNKASRANGTKRQLSHNDVQTGIIADSLSYSVSAKRRHSSEVPTIETHSLENQATLKVLLESQTNFSKPVTNLSYLNQQPASVAFMQTPAIDHIYNRRSKSANAQIGGNVTLSSVGFVMTKNLENLPTSQNKGLVLQNSIENLFASNSKEIPAPNVTITQGMLVSLPTAVLPSSSNQRVYSIASQLNDLINQPKPLVNTVSSLGIIHKQTLADANLSAVQNGLSQSLKKYSLDCNIVDQHPPNVSLPYSLSLQGLSSWGSVELRETVTDHKAAAFKRTNSTIDDDNKLLHKLIVQQVEKKDSSIPSISSVTQILQNSQSNINTLNAASTRQPSSNDNLQTAHLLKQKAQSQQYIQHSYQPQILPKLSSAQTLTQYPSPTVGQASLQFISHGSSSNGHIS